jgi:hypothetical protein
LVSQDAPIFGNYFEPFTLKDINLNEFWGHDDPWDYREPVSLNNHTFPEVTKRLKQPMVNIYTIKLEEFGSKFGIALLAFQTKSKYSFVGKKSIFSCDILHQL